MSATRIFAICVIFVMLHVLRTTFATPQRNIVIEQGRSPYGVGSDTIITRPGYGYRPQETVIVSNSGGLGSSYVSPLQRRRQILDAAGRRTVVLN